MPPWGCCNDLPPEGGPGDLTPPAGGLNCLPPEDGPGDLTPAGGLIVLPPEGGPGDLKDFPPDGGPDCLPPGGVLNVLPTVGGLVLLRLKMDSDPPLTPVERKLFDLGAPIPANVLPWNRSTGSIL